MEVVAHHWQGEMPVEKSLLNEPFRFQFLQAVRILESIQKRAHQGAGGIRFRSRVSFVFPASELDAVKLAPASEVAAAAEMTVNFLGLAGALGPLPQAYTEMILEAALRHDMAAVDFLDIFNHRLVWLLYCAHKAHNVTLTVEPPSRGEAAQYLFSLIGLGHATLRDRVGIPDSALLHYSGLLARNVRTAVGLERLLADYFGVNVRVHQFLGCWRVLDASQWSKIGLQGMNQTLGAGAVLGKRVWDEAGGVLLEMGPLHLAQFYQFLPGEPANVQLTKLARFYVGSHFRIQARLRLRASELLEAPLGESRLGYTSWLSKLKKPGPDGTVNFFLEDECRPHSSKPI
jgi:type VI secretion system protein ImpH